MDRRRERHEQTRQEILDAAWRLAGEQGLAAMSLRELAARVNMRAPSLYSYFGSKHAIYDALFAEGYRRLNELIDAELPDGPPDDDEGVALDLVRDMAHRFVAFAVEDPVRYQLLFQRTVPDFEPSDESYALAVEVLQRSARILEVAGVRGQGALDLWTALLTGLTDQQISNDPGGDRWVRLVDDAVEMFLDHARPGWRHALAGTGGGRAGGTPRAGTSGGEGNTGNGRRRATSV